MNNNTDYSTLEKRVGHLETDVDAIKISMAALNARSESFATKADLEGVKASIERDIAGIYREIAVQARWLIAAIVTVNGVAIGIAKLIS